MQDFWQFAGGYWWLIFPLMGVAGGVFRAWDRGARARHQRRMEVLHAKAEIRAAASDARASRRTPAPVAAAAPVPVESDTDRVQKLLDAQDAVTARWLEYELDVAKLIAYPAMSDGRQPLTAAFLRAKKVADRLRPASAKAKLPRDQFEEYRNAVTDYEVAFDVAERDAKRIRDSSFSETERKRLEVAKQLLTVAVDEAATPAERQLAYRRVREELDGLLSLSDGAIEVLEKKVALQLPATPAADAAPPASGSTTGSHVAPAADDASAPPSPAPPGAPGPETADPAHWPVPGHPGTP